MILLSEIPPTTFTLMFGWVCSNALTVFLTTPSSRSENPTQSVMLPDACLALPPAGVPEDAAFWESSLPPPQPLATSTASTAATIAARLMSTLRWLDFLTSGPYCAAFGPSSSQADRQVR